MVPDVDPALSFRLFVCEARDCGRQVTLCTRCDRGQRYCSGDCRRRERAWRHREANRRYARSFAARRLGAARQARCRAARRARAKKVTDHAPPRPPAPAIVGASPAPVAIVAPVVAGAVEPDDVPTALLPRRPPAACDPHCTGCGRAGRYLRTHSLPRRRRHGRYARRPPARAGAP